MYLDNLFKESPHIQINQLSCNSKENMKDCIFFCVKGIKYNGHNFIDEAIENGASVIVYSDDINTDKDVIFIKVNNVDEALKDASNIFYDYPSKKLETYVVSGTCGRSSVVNIINKILSKRKKVSSIGVFGINYGDDNLFTNQPTLTLLDNQKQMKLFIEKKCDVCLFEASALSLSYKKLDTVNPNVFTYVHTCDDSSEFRECGMNYMDFLKNYLYTLENTTSVVLNRDDISFDVLNGACGSNKITYGQNIESDFVIENIKLSNIDTSFDIRHNEKIFKIKTNLVGLSNVYNATAALLSLYTNGYKIDDAINELSQIDCVDGVLDRLNFDDYNIYVDCAQSSKEHEQILQFAKKIKKADKKIICLISINTTDSIERLSSLMNTVSQYANFVILTEDDTYEDDIVEKLLLAKRFLKAKCLIIEDREEAIEEAIELLNKNDILLLLGKGNENFLYKGLVKKNYVGDKNLAYKYMKKRIKEENSI